MKNMEAVSTLFHYLGKTSQVDQMVPHLVDLRAKGRLPRPYIDARTQGAAYWRRHIARHMDAPPLVRWSPNY